MARKIVGDPRCIHNLLVAASLRMPKGWRSWLKKHQATAASRFLTHHDISVTVYRFLQFCELMGLAIVIVDKRLVPDSLLHHVVQPCTVPTSSWFRGDNNIRRLAPRAFKVRGKKKAAVTAAMPISVTMPGERTAADPFATSFYTQEGGDDQNR